MVKGESHRECLPELYGGGPRAMGRGSRLGCLPGGLILDGVIRWGMGTLSVCSSESRVRSVAWKM